MRRSHPRASRLRALAGARGSVHHEPLALEPLEERRVMAAGPAAGYNPSVFQSGTEIYIQGTSVADNIGVAKSGSYLAITVNGSTTNVLLSSVTRIHADLKGGDDYFAGYQSMYPVSIPMEVDGGAGYDTISTGTGSDRVDGGDYADTISTHGGADTVDGGNGGDTIRAGGSADVIQGGAGADFLSGEDGADDINGGDGVDQIQGGGSGDELSGDEGDDLIWGDDGPDVLAGLDGNDRLWGGDDNDTLYGGTGNDDLYGESNDDTLLGHDGDDYISGGAGDDDLYGGDGDDELNGGSGLDGLLPGFDGWSEDAAGGDGVDRFLLPEGERVTYNGSTYTVYEDEADDYTSSDAKVWLANGNEVWAWDHKYAADSWNEDELQLLDEALAVLHHATDNNNLLEQADGYELTFTKVGGIIQTNPGATFTAAAWNGNGQITLTDLAFTGDDWATQVIFHEVGHNWDKEYDEAGWNTLSSWVPKFGTSAWPNSTLSGDGEWFYGNSAEFVRSYATENPREDFACSFGNYFLNKTSYTHSVRSLPYKDISLIAGKLAFLNDMVADLS